MTKQQTSTIKMTAIVLSMILAAGSVLFAFGAQGQKLNRVVKDQAATEIQVDNHSSAITTLKADVKYIREGIDDIKDEIKK